MLTSQQHDSDFPKIYCPEYEECLDWNKLIYIDKETNNSWKEFTSEEIQLTSSWDSCRFCSWVDDQWLTSINK